MPLYEFTCKHCSKTFEELSSGSDKAACPACGTTDTERVLFSRIAVGKAAGAQAAAPSPCGRCGDPRGPGACSMN